MGKIKITCKEATAICTKAQYGEASLLDKIKLNLHFVYCKTCRLFSRQNSELSDICALAKKYQESHKCCLSAEDKERLKAQIKELDKEK
ncbi:benzoyl-CoA reductase/2-hydroxyglutaryl-CoA dehydratase subunit BcrC/BadD/HgdB [Wenyingzhuangia heitensis]|uniref:Benzoyl-CoA reductase/2-hydroxyglutaryl-CoA dehydratase subunit BcrC/BadD/HgdB n=1 Tax=Wenyingzhuangia heitensis TaxID=1487859 RepID=A0ABX0U6P3_9FLAO|nr:hypothetical protein [Wenyingzhuangia heitensis]NIJ44518.1 benzoyl-CoA reductase/2-hydroxyglutaryl-CoA dehydratase subunit BcrC/BadD/HgdB [Wenyingzhuangia heitensis]